MALNPFLVQLLLAVAVSVVAYLIAPKPKGPTNPAVKDLDNPVAEAGKPIPVVFGTMTVKGLNILWFGEKESDTFKISAGDAKK